MTCIPDVPSSLPVGTPFGPECEERPLAWLHGTTRTAKRVSPEKGGGKEHPSPSLLSCVYNFLALFITPRYAYLLLVIVGSLRKRLNQCSAVPGEETFNPLYAPSGLPFKLLHRRYLSLEGDSMAVFPDVAESELDTVKHLFRHSTFILPSMVPVWLAAVETVQEKRQVGWVAAGDLIHSSRSLLLRGYSELITIGRRRDSEPITIGRRRNNRVKPLPCCCLVWSIL